MSKKKMCLAGYNLQGEEGRQNEKSDRASFPELFSLIRMNDFLNSPELWLGD
jgi:hypothetical protein